MLLLSFNYNSQVYVNGEKVADVGSEDIAIVNGEVYLDGKSIDELKEDVNSVTNKEPVHKKETNVYRTKNVDAYNKWYNEKGKTIKEKKKKCMMVLFYIILGVAAFVILIVSIRFIIAELEYRSQNKSTKLPEPSKYTFNQNPNSDSGLPEVKSPIKKNT